MNEKPKENLEEVEVLSKQCQNLDQKMDKILDKIKRRKQKKAS